MRVSPFSPARPGLYQPVLMVFDGSVADSFGCSPAGRRPGSGPDQSLRVRTGSIRASGETRGITPRDLESAYPMVVFPVRRLALTRLDLLWLPEGTLRTAAALATPILPGAAAPGAAALWFSNGPRLPYPISCDRDKLSFVTDLAGTARQPLREPASGQVSGRATGGTPFPAGSRW
jgi:hypothetical protein